MGSDQERATPQRTLMFGLLFLLLLIAAIIIGFVFFRKPEAAAPTPTVALTAPAAPSDLTADAVAVFDVPVGWKDNSDNEDGFNIYRQRLDVAGNKEKAGSTGKDTTSFLDGGTVCGATYKYTVASFNAAGESPTTPCWQIALPACPTPQDLKLDVGNKTLDPDVYLSVDGASLTSDGASQNGIVDLGSVGSTPLDQVALPQPPGFKSGGLAVVAGHTYAVLMADGKSVHVLTVTSVDASMADTTGIIWRPGGAISGACTGPLPTRTPPPTDTPTSTEKITETATVPVSTKPACSDAPGSNNPCTPPTTAVTVTTPPACSDLPGSNNPCTPPTEETTPPPGVCEKGWVPVGVCVCCGPDRVCPDHVEVNHSDCQQGGRNNGGGGQTPDVTEEVCTCIPISPTSNKGYCKENRSRSCVVSP